MIFTKRKKQVEFDEILITDTFGVDAEYLRKLIGEIRKSEISYKKLRLVIKN